MVGDEPTTGLYFDNINKVLTAFRGNNADGSRLVEHNLDVIKTAGYMIGPK